MTAIRDLSIRNKLIIIILSVTLFSLGLASTVIIYFDIQSLRKDKINEATITARLVGNYCIVPLTFEDSDAIKQVLQSLLEIPYIDNCFVYDTDDSLVSSCNDYSVDELPDSTLGSEFSYFEESFLYVGLPIEYRDMEFGTIVIRASTEDLDSAINSRILTVSLVVLGVIFVTYLLAVKLQGLISRPILNLAEVTRKIGEHEDYSIRLGEQSKDEIGDLYKSFDNMLGQIYERDTARTRAQDLLKESEAKYRTITENIQVGIFRSEGLNGKIIEANSAFIEMFGFDSREELLRSDPFKLYFNSDDRLDIYNYLIVNDSIRDRIVKYIRRDGTLFSASITVFTVRDESGNILHFDGMVENITDKIAAENEKKKLQSQIVHMQKMESIGRLAGGIAHDFNNILTSVMGYAELLSLQYPDTNTQVGQAANIILKGTVKAADLTKQLLGFARGGKYNPVPLDLNYSLKETMEVSGKIFEKNITVVYNLESNLRAVEADENQINQVFTNLIINAKDAMPNGGTLRISTENIILDRMMISDFADLKPGPYVKVSVEDTGIGMSEMIREQIFEPFFTTKGSAKGTGLGLATVYGIVKNHNGHVTVYSEPEKGTLFSVYLPVSDREAAQQETVPEVVRGNATVMVVDDELLVRQISQDMLTKLGYTVILAENGRHAVDIYRREMHNIDVVLLDMIMPEMAGKEANKELRKLNKNVKVILSSGYSQDGKAAGILQEGVTEFIQKPFRIDILSKTIARVLES